MNLAYNISGNLGGYLNRIDKLRLQFALHPISPKDELKLKWKLTADRIAFSLSVLDENITPESVISVLKIHSDSSKKRAGKLEKDVLAQKHAFNYIKESWQANKSAVSLNTIKKLYMVSCFDTLGKMTGLTEYSEMKINTFLEYLQGGQDHPVIQAGIAQIEILNITPFDNGNGRIARLLSYLYFYKNGYDFRDCILFEEYIKSDPITYRRILDLTKTQGNLTLWLEYFAYAVLTSMEKVWEDIKNERFGEGFSKTFWNLNSRQKQIVDQLQDPSVKVTNKIVQKLYKVSQITASRDLAKLTGMGILLAHGKGRSVSYTKV